jgi:hypothetical protein
MPPVAEKSNIPFYDEESRKASLTTWWAIGSISFGALAAAFLPTAMIGGGDWSASIYNVWPMWVVCCTVGVITGIRGMAERKLTNTQRLTAAAGTLLSLGAFVVLTLIAMFGGT